MSSENNQKEETQILTVDENDDVVEKNDDVVEKNEVEKKEETKETLQTEKTHQSDETLVAEKNNVEKKNEVKSEEKVEEKKNEEKPEKDEIIQTEEIVTRVQKFQKVEKEEVSKSDDLVDDTEEKETKKEEVTVENKNDEDDEENDQNDQKSLFHKVLILFTFPLLPLLLMFRDSSILVKIKIKEAKEFYAFLKKKYNEIAEMKVKDVIFLCINWYLSIYKYLFFKVYSVFLFVMGKVLNFLGEKAKKKFEEKLEESKKKLLEFYNELIKDGYVNGAKKLVFMAFSFVVAQYAKLFKLCVGVVVYVSDEYILGEKKRHTITHFVGKKLDSLMSLVFRKNKEIETPSEE